MREIKFRIYHEKNKYFYYHQNENCCVWDDLWGTYPENINQYTELKDKNEKEIYEGDIITKYGIPTIVMFGIYDNYSHDPEMLVEGNGFYLQHINSNEISKFVYMGSEEIIGNIYENPELLVNKQ
jgi:uncharacterized phage protein (TIGR01671 family)